MTKKEIKNFSESDTEKRYEITPDKNKCFQSKRTGHKFIHSITGEGLPLYITEEEQATFSTIYQEVKIKD